MKKNVILAGAAPSTGNLGVSALCQSIVSGLQRVSSDLELTILDYGSGFRPKAYNREGVRACDLLGAKPSRRFYDRSAISNIKASMCFGGLGSTAAKVFRESSAVLDISGGDSFTDLYGNKRFDAVNALKTIAVKYKIPLVLLPQTYGPFFFDKSEAIARSFLLKSEAAYARDNDSLLEMKRILGFDFDSTKHKLGVDVAFLLPSSDPELALEKGIVSPRSGRELFGINVSGLIYNAPRNAKSRFSISLDYRSVMRDLIRYILKNSDGDVCLIPHVIGTGKDESDELASHELRASLSESEQSRVLIVQGPYNESEVKAIISQCTWFCGTRMHATIAALSSGVPTAALAYSGKTAGVFETAGQKHRVIDARRASAQEASEALSQYWRARDSDREMLLKIIPEVKERARNQIGEISAVIGKL